MILHPFKSIGLVLPWIFKLRPRSPKKSTMHFSINRTEFAEAVAVTVVNIAALGLLGLTAGYWTWQWFAPAPEASLQSRPEAGGQIASALDLFGVIQRDENVPVSTGNAIRLLGVVAAAEGRDAYAIVILDEKQIVATRKGEDIVPGFRLAEVTPDHVVLERNGVRESLALPKKELPAGNVPTEITPAENPR